MTILLPPEDDAHEILTRWPDVFWDLEVKCMAAVPITLDLLKGHLVFFG